MKTFTFRYEASPLDKAFARMKKVMDSGVPDVRGDEVVCDGLDSMLKVMSKSRFELFAAILEYRPESLYELAKRLGKDQAQVLREARSLEALGLISLNPVKDGGRERLKPKALYERITFEFQPKKVAKVG